MCIIIFWRYSVKHWISNLVSSSVSRFLFETSCSYFWILNYNVLVYFSRKIWKISWKRRNRQRMYFVFLSFSPSSASSSLPFARLSSNSKVSSEAFIFKVYLFQKVSLMCIWSPLLIILCISCVLFPVMLFLNSVSYCTLETGLACTHCQ